MKKLFFAALIATTVATTAFATDAKKIGVRVHNSFKADYGNIENVNWTLRDNFAKASFQLNGEKMEAFYDVEGNNIGTSKAIAVDAIPTSAKRALAKKFADYTVTEAIQFDGVDESAYYISADNSHEKLVLKVSATDIVSVYKRTSK
ncbi:hypothetical protein [Aridibaculum aurantiacum]|uniref:hypothetical protein n=1 Tax=Aridibaculum aurantiacum TaxID=2810307 RepID=UPI001A972097|nr:hypothetical protein [Aridibaculum aurantiacum]